MISMSYLAATVIRRATSGGPSGNGGRVSVRRDAGFLEEVLVPAGVKRMSVSAVRVSTVKECSRPQPTKTVAPAGAANRADRSSARPLPTRIPQTARSSLRAYRLTPSMMLVPK